MRGVKLVWLKFSFWFCIRDKVGGLAACCPYCLHLPDLDAWYDPLRIWTGLLVISLHREGTCFLVHLLILALYHQVAVYALSQVMHKLLCRLAWAYADLCIRAWCWFGFGNYYKIVLTRLRCKVFYEFWFFFFPLFPIILNDLMRCGIGSIAVSSCEG